MKSVLVKKENNEATFTMEFSGEEFDAATQAAYIKNRDKFVINGFRRGKAPRSIIERMYGVGIFFEDAIDALLNDNYGKALDELDLDVIDRPNVDFGEDKIEKGKGFTATIKVPVAPEPSVKDYKGVEIEKTVHKVDAKEVNESIEALRKRNARLVSVDRPAENKDTVVLDYAGFCDGNQFEGGTAENQNLVLGSGTFIPGFEDQLVGCKAGDEKDVVVTFPEEYHEASLAGKEATFKCKVHEVKMEELPELDDEFAKDVSEFDTLKELKADTKKRLQENYNTSAENVAKNALVDKIVEANKFDVPKVMIETEQDKLVQDFAQNMSYQGIDLKMYCQFTGKTEDDIKAEFAEQAEKNVMARLILGQIVKAEKLDVTDADVDAELKKIAEDYGMEIEKVKDALAGSDELAFLKDNIKSRKAIDFCYANAKVTEKEAVEEKPKKEKAEKPEAEKAE